MDQADPNAGGGDAASGPPSSREEQRDADRELLRRSKISPHLSSAAADWGRRRFEQQSLGIGDTAAAPVVKALIELNVADTTELEQTGIPFTHQFDLVYLAEVPLDRLDELAGLQTVLRVHHDRNLRPSLDDSIPEIRASTVRNAHFPFTGSNKFTGDGVLVGIIDSGINILHPGSGCQTIRPRHVSGPSLIKLRARRSRSTKSRSRRPSPPTPS